MLFLFTVLSLPSYLMFSNGKRKMDVQTVVDPTTGDAENATRRLLTDPS